MAKYYKASYKNLFPPLMPYVIEDDNSLTNDFGQYTLSKKRVISPSVPGVVVANNQVSDTDNVIEISCSDGLTSVTKNLTLGTIKSSSDWVITNDIVTAAGKGINLTYAGSNLTTDPYNIFFESVEPGSRLFYEQTNTMSWDISPNLGLGTCYLTIDDIEPVITSIVFVIPYGCGWNDTCYSFPEYPAKLIKIRALNILNNETIGIFFIAYVAFSAGVSGFKTSWDY
jgi:hypothetical protein